MCVQYKLYTLQKILFSLASGLYKFGKRPFLMQNLMDVMTLDFDIIHNKYTLENWNVDQHVVKINGSIFICVICIYYIQNLNTSQTDKLLLFSLFSKLYLQGVDTDSYSGHMQIAHTLYLELVLLIVAQGWCRISQTKVIPSRFHLH